MAASNGASGLPNLILRLALPSPLRRLFDYLPPRGVDVTRLQPGVRLRVPFGRREMIGILVEVTDHSEVPAEKLKPAIALLDATPPLPPCGQATVTLPSGTCAPCWPPAPLPRPRTSP